MQRNKHDAERRKNFVLIRLNHPMFAQKKINILILANLPKLCPLSPSLFVDSLRQLTLLCKLNFFQSTKWNFRFVNFEYPLS